MGIIKVFRCDSAFSDEIHLPESIFDKVELYDLKNALHPGNSLFIELSLEEYEMIKNKIIMNIQIKISDYYGIPAYYSVMPQSIFDSLEMTALNGNEYADVDKVQFDKMIEDYKLKMKNQ